MTTRRGAGAGAAGTDGAGAAATGSATGAAASLALEAALVEVAGVACTATDGLGTSAGFTATGAVGGTEATAGGGCVPAALDAAGVEAERTVVDPGGTT